MDSASENDFREFVESRSNVLLRIAVLLSGGDRQAAEDLLQNALIKLANRWHSVEEPEAYVRQVLYRAQISRWRLRWPHREVIAAQPPDSAGGDAAHDVELRVVLRHALRRLTARQRAVLVLRYYEDLPEGEVAELLGCTVGTVRSTAHRSLAKLRAQVPELSPYSPGATGRDTATPTHSEVGP